MIDKNNIPAISKEQFEFVQSDTHIMDTKFDTKPIGSFKDAWLRFKRNKSSIVAVCVISFLILFSLIVPIFAQYPLSFRDELYTNKKPKSLALSKIGIMRGLTEKELGQKGYDFLVGIGVGVEDYEGKGGITHEQGLNNEFCPIVGEVDEFTSQGRARYSMKVDGYKEVGFSYDLISTAEFDRIRQYEQESGLKILYPMVDILSIKSENISGDANYWYKIDDQGNALKDEKGNLVPNYIYDEDGNALYAMQRDRGIVQVRRLYYNYFIMTNGKEPAFFLGTNSYGYDLLIRLAVGLRTSFIFSICVASICLIIGAIIGAIEGYYGGWVDLIMERIIDVINGVPFMIIITLFNFYLVITGKVSPIIALLFAYISVGWIGTSGTVRTQFYRYKNKEYVHAARTLGAPDRRIMFKHIFPNAIGTIITSSVLVIPGVIFGESTLSYLGIVNLGGPNASSLGTMLADGNTVLASYPHIIFFPAVVISLLMICFNLFGNGLRDAFNPSLRGSEG